MTEATPAAPNERELDIPQLTEAAGWPCNSGRKEHGSVALDTRRSGRIARVVARGGGVRLSTELTDWEELPQRVRDALSLYLLLANARVRLVRVVLTEDEAGGAAELEVVFAGPPSAEELNTALEALSVGADLCGPEAEVFLQETAATLFLSVWGGPHSTGKTQLSKER